MKDNEIDAQDHPMYKVNTMTNEIDHECNFINPDGKVNIGKLRYDKDKLFEAEGVESCFDFNTDRLNGWKEISKIIFTSDQKFKTYLHNYRIGLNKSYGQEMKNFPMYSVLIPKPKEEAIKAKMNRRASKVKKFPQKRVAYLPHSQIEQNKHKAKFLPRVPTTIG
ncbi:unnamed protein product [Moneuplotes crassus]|uniref:Uncharacterized protein n=1 Tax=Euplotes crassus TaxID=5936 RepID=A0AAD1X7T2_EUPCR|nr:unnamed protein product [Moneuplotes crassus]